MTVRTNTGANAPVRRSVLVQAGAAQCWAALIGRIGAWWPLVGHSCTEDPASGLTFVDGSLVETGTDGQRFVWGTVSRWEPPHGLVMSWHPGRPADSVQVTEVEWRLTELDAGATLVEVLHRGWERLDDSDRVREEYANGWPAVLGGLVDSLAEEMAPSFWHILTHTPGRAAERGIPLQRQPLFAGHERFLQSLTADGLLVAAGPLPQTPGAGQTVVRGLTTEQATERATADEAVAGGLLDVAVQPWIVVSRG